MEAAAYWLDETGIQKGTPEAFFSFFDGGKHVISLVGGGGKTTLAYHLADCFVRRGKKTVIMTTTRMGCPPVSCCSMEECVACWARGEYAVCGRKTGEGKFRAPEPELLSRILAAADAVIVEADGAHRLPCKAPDVHEPQILPESDVVIAVMGLDALDRPVKEICHRPQIVCGLLGCEPEHCVTAEDMAKILLSPLGSKKNVGDRTYYAVLNKCDDDQRIAAGKGLLSLLREKGHAHAVLTGGMRRSETFEFVRAEQKQE